MEEYHLVEGKIMRVSSDVLKDTERNFEQKIKQQFTAKYFGQQVQVIYSTGFTIEITGQSIQYIGDKEFLLLREVGSMTDDEAIKIARMAHQKYNSYFKVRRDDGHIHVQYEDEVGITYHISIYKNYGTINANLHFSKTEKESASSYKANIGETTISSQRPVPYIAIIDFLRAKSFLTQFSYIDENGQFATLSPADIIKLGWAIYKTN